MPDNEQNLKSLVQRVSLLEARVTELESRFASPEEPTGKIKPKQTEVNPPAISIKLLSKTFHRADYNAGDSGDRIELSFEFSNHLQKDIRAFIGTVVFKDLFDRDILRVGVSEEEGVRAGGTTVWRGGIEYNQFMNEHSRLLTVNNEDLQVSFILQQVIYRDGTREVFEE